MRDDVDKGAPPTLDAACNKTPTNGGAVRAVSDDVGPSKSAEAELRYREAWLAGQKEAFQSAVNGAPLDASLGVLVRTAVEQMDPDVRCAFYIADAGRTELVHVTGMPDSYAECVDGFKIGPDSLACGLAVYTGRPIVTPDVTKELRWKPWLWLAERYEFRACWSFPIEPAPGNVIGTFAMYFKTPREATARDYESAAVLTRAAAIIISRTRERRFGLAGMQERAALVGGTITVE